MNILSSNSKYLDVAEDIFCNVANAAIITFPLQSLPQSEPENSLTAR